MAGVSNLKINERSNVEWKFFKFGQFQKFSVFKSQKFPIWKMNFSSVSNLVKCKRKTAHKF